MTTEQATYDAGAVEAARQEAWSRRGAFETPVPPEGRSGVYVKPSSPFTSGNLHMGHVRDYAIGDAYARFRRARGDAVLFGFGFDAFGLPAELAAIERREPPADWVGRSGERMLAQMRRLGFSFDYEPRLLQLRRGAVPLVAMALPYPARRRFDLPRRRHRRLVRSLPDHARRAPGRGRPLLALPQRGPPHPPPDLVPAHRALPRGERPQPRPARALGRALPRHAALHPGAQRRGGARPRGVRRPRPHRLHAPPGLGRRGALRAALAAPPGRSRRGPRDRASEPSWTRCARAAGSAAPATPRWCRRSTPGHRSPAPRAASFRSSYRRSSTPATARPRRSASPRSTRPTRRSGGGCRAPLSRRRPERRAGQSSRGRPPATAPPTSRSPASATGGRRSRSSTASDAGRSRSLSRSCRCACRATSSRPGKATRSPSAPTSSTSLPALRRAGQARDRHPRLPLRRAVAVDTRRGAPRGSGREDVRAPRPAPVAAGRAPRRRRRQRRLRLRPARPHQGAARHRPALLPRGRRALRRLPLPRDGDRRAGAR